MIQHNTDIILVTCYRVTVTPYNKNDVLIIYIQNLYNKIQLYTKTNVHINDKK